MADSNFNRLERLGDSRLRAIHDLERDHLWQPSNVAVAVTVIVPMFGIAGMGFVAWLSDFSGPQIAMSCAFALVPSFMIAGGIAGYFAKARFQDGPTYVRLGWTGRVVLATIGLALFATVYVLAPLIPL